MTLTELDKELMEVLALRVPWYMVCGEFHARYGSAGALARRLFELEQAELVEIRNRTADGEPLTAATLEADALANGCYEDLEDTREPEWDITATDRGFAIVENRLGKQ